MGSNEFIEIIKKLIKENKELKNRVYIMETILHSYLPIIERKKNGSRKSKVKPLLQRTPPRRFYNVLLKVQKGIRFLYRFLAKRRDRK